MILNDLPTNLIAKLDELREQHESLSAQLLEPDVRADHRRGRSISIKRAAIEPIVTPDLPITQGQQFVAELFIQPVEVIARFAERRGH